MNSPIITLTTDFGWQDSYVAEMKGVILSKAPLAQIVDVSHEIAPQDIVHGAFVLSQTAAAFPAGSIHVAVIDPGVGTERDVICVTAREQHFILPDNGLMTFIVDRHEPSQIIRIDPTHLQLNQVSNTFHGRDIMAPAAAFVAEGNLAKELGVSIEHLVRIDFEPAECSGTTCTAHVLHVDHFGNVVTNLTSQQKTLPQEGSIVSLSAKQRAFELLAVSTYGNAREGDLVLLQGSHGRWEIAKVNDSANELLQLSRHDRVEFDWR